MEMPELLELLTERQGDLSDEEFANAIGFRGSTLWRYKNKQSVINNAVRQKMIQHFLTVGDAEMIGALLAYKTGAILDRRQLNDLGKHFLSEVDQGLVPA